jgi:hypothetical protein
MGQHPYVPRDVISAGRYRPTGRVRVVDYPDPYPIRATKIVTLEDLDGQSSEGEQNSEFSASTVVGGHNGTAVSSLWLRSFSSQIDRLTRESTPDR